MVGSGRGRARRIGATVLVVAGAMLLLLGGPLLYAREEVFDSHAFAVHATHTLDDENVRKALGDAVLDQVTEKAGPELLSFRPRLRDRPPWRGAVLALPGDLSPRSQAHP